LIYLDTSVIVALLSNESSAPAIMRWYAKNDQEVFVSADWSLTEFSSALAMKVRTKQLSPKQAKAVQNTFDTFIGGLRLLAVSRHAFEQGAHLIQSMDGLRAGGALHLAVALEAGATEFATLDLPLGERASHAGLTLTNLGQQGV
jgi:predicted nucleic acid-binding protein